MNRYKYLTLLSLTVLFLAACGSSGGLGDILGGGSPTTNEIRGVVDYVDTANRSIVLTNVSGYGSMLSSGGSSGNSVRVYYDNSTTVEFGGQTHRPEDLERGDEVSVRVDQSGNTLVADRVTVLRDVTPGDSGIGSNIRGTIRFVDTSRRQIEVDRGFGSAVIVDYDTNVPVYFSGRTYNVSDLERGDEIDIRVRDLGNGRFAAQDITVTRSISSGSLGSSNYATIRGTVRSHDPSRRTIELEQANWITGFNTGTTTGNRVVIQYSSNASVEYQGQMHPVSGLERGDVIEVQVQNLGSGNLLANRIALVRDVRF
jgi:hypothetical protein